MYTVTIMNSTGAAMTTGDGQTIKPGGTWKSGNLGTTYVHSELFGALSLVDIGDQHIGGDSSETWGVLIGYGGESVVGRYEGGGQLEITFNEFLQAVVSGMDLRQVDLNSIAIQTQTPAKA